MVGNNKRQKMGSITEEDIFSILQRYSATTVLALLQEVEQVAEGKIDWDALVKKTNTGISNPREYQMVWRRLAYRHAMVETLDDDTQPLDDNSDLEYELEALPTVTSEASTEAAACVKVLIASGASSKASLQNGLTVEAPLMISIPSGKSTRVPTESSQISSFMHVTNIIVPVAVQKQPLPTVTAAEAFDANGSTSGHIPPRRKRKPWSAVEDQELIEAVKKCGEGNWANILKGDFKSERSASQLSQRWNIIRKRKGNSSIVQCSESQLSEAQLAARRAVNMALDMPMADSLKPSSTTAGTSLAATLGNSVCPAVESSSLCLKPQHQSQQDSGATVAQRPGASGPISKQETYTGVTQRSGETRTSVTQRSGALAHLPRGQVTLKKTSTKSAPSPDELVKAAAVAAGARIATPHDATSLLKVAHVKNTVHIMPSIKSSVGGNTNSLPSNVHFIRTGLATTLSTYSSVPPIARSAGTQQLPGHTMRPRATTQINQDRSSPELNAASEVIKADTSSMDNEVKINNSDAIVKPGAEANVTSGNLKDRTAFAGSAQTEVKVNNSVLKEEVPEKPASSLGEAPQEQIDENQASGLSTNDQIGVSGNQATQQHRKTNEDQIMDIQGSGEDDDKPIVVDTCGTPSVSGKPDEPARMEICENPSVNVNNDETTSMVVDGNDVNMEVIGMETTETETLEDEKMSWLRRSLQSDG